MTEPQSFEEAVDRVLAEMRSVLIERQRKYGPTNIARHGEIGLAVRCGDKLARLDNYYFGKGKETPDESVDDSWTDLANYGAIALMYRRGLWGLPLCTSACKHTHFTLAANGDTVCSNCGEKVTVNA